MQTKNAAGSEQPFVHPLSDVQTSDIGHGSKIWQFCVILPGVKIGKNCNICSHVFIEEAVEIGNNVTIKNGVQLWKGVRLEDDVFIGPNATFCNDLFPRSKQHPPEYLATTIGRGASIGANATILPGISIGAGSMIGAGAVITRSVPPGAVVLGNPGKVIRLLETE